VRPWAGALLAALAIAAAAAQPARAAVSRPSLDRPPSAILVDAGDGDVILQKRPDQRRPIASTTKLMTALLAVEHTRPSEVFTAPGYAALPAESTINLRAGERLTVEDLMEGLLLASANDAAVTIAQGVAGSRPRFVDEMNRRAAQLGLTGTHYANPIGLDDPGNFSTARDLAKLASRLMSNRRFEGIVRREQSVLQSGAHRRVVSNRNLLVGRYPGVDGVKTGHTIDARFVLVGSASRRGARVVSVVLGEPSEAARDTDTLGLLRYGLSLFRPRAVLRRGQAVARPRAKYRDDRVNLVPAHPLTLDLRRGESVVRRVRAPEELKGPIPAGRRVGSVTVVEHGKAVSTVPLVTASRVPKAGTLRKLTWTLGWPLTLLVLLAILAGVAVLARRLRAGRPTTAR
jgi:serine-type D-Ala-D-Ala carboxypeptidase (penicillin-binding protein 5/6)